MLMRFDPFRELDRLTQQAFAGGAQVSGMPMDAYRRGDRFVVHFDVPGVDPSSIDLTVEKNVLTVSAERSWARHDDDQIVIAERPQGRISRQLFLGESLDADGIEAHCDNGVLTVTVPVAERAKARKVEIGSGAGRREAIDARSTESTAEGAEQRQHVSA
jgi:HSP20 family protein